MVRTDHGLIAGRLPDINLPDGKYPIPDYFDVE